MDTFAYEARDKRSVLIKGKIRATDVDQAADQLIKDNLIPLHIRKISSRLSWRFPSLSFSSSLFLPKISDGTLVFFCRQMYSLDKAGISIVASIKRVAEITTHKTLMNALKAVLQEISAGTSLSQAMGRSPNVFPSLLVALIRSGEANGRLDEAFLAASKHYEFEHISHRRLKTILRYPMFVMGFAFAAIMLINIFVIPRFAQLYASFHTALPLPTRMLINFSTFVHDYWWIIIIFVLIIVTLAFYFLRHPAFRTFIDRSKMKLPIFGSIVEHIVMASFSRSLAMLLQTGITVMKSLTLTADIVNNNYAKEKILEILQLIERGKNLSQAANTVHFLSPLILQILSVGEKTGSVDKMLLELSYFYEQEIDYDIKRLADIIEPLLLIMVGLIVILLALGVFLPMWSLVYTPR